MRLLNFLMLCLMAVWPTFLFPSQAHTEADSQKKKQTSVVVSLETPYKVGLMCPLSGPYANIGSKQMEEIAGLEEEVNAKGGINGRWLYILGPAEIKALPERFSKYQRGRFQKMNQLGQLINGYFGGKYREYMDTLVYDTQGDETKAVEALNRLIEKKVLVILGPAFRSTTEKVIPMAEKEKIPLISFATGVTIVGAPTDWVFTAKPFEAISTVIEALRTAGAEKEMIRDYLEKRLKQQSNNLDKDTNRDKD